MTFWHKLSTHELDSTVCSIQMTMSVPLTMVAVTTNAKIMVAILRAVVKMAMFCRIMEGLVSVKKV